MVTNKFIIVIDKQIVVYYFLFNTYKKKNSMNFNCFNASEQYVENSTSLKTLLENRHTLSAFSCEVFLKDMAFLFYLTFFTNRVSAGGSCLMRTSQIQGVEVVGNHT